MPALLLAAALPATAAPVPDYLTHREPPPVHAPALPDAFGRRPGAVPADDTPVAAMPGHPWWRSGALDVHVRSFYLEADREDATDSLAWALGGWLGYRSGYWRERLRLGTTAYTTQPLYAPKQKPGSKLLHPVQEGFTVIGQAYVDIKLAEQAELRLYRQIIDLPYVNEQDSRMVPVTFEAYALRNPRHQRVHYTLGHVTQMKPREDSGFQSMSEVAGAADTDHGLTMAALDLTPTASTSLGLVNHYAWDVMNIFYTEAALALTPAPGLGVKVSAQYTDQRSVGEALIGAFATYQYGLKAALSWRAIGATVGYTSVGIDSGIQNPYGGYPGYASLLIKDFDRAGENAWVVGLSADLAGLGVEGLSGFLSFANGDTPNSGSAASPTQDEIDITLDYRPKQGLLKGLWLRARAGWLDQYGAGAQDQADYHFVVNYEVPLK